MPERYYKSRINIKLLSDVLLNFHYLLVNAAYLLLQVLLRHHTRLLLLLNIVTLTALPIRLSSRLALAILLTLNLVVALTRYPELSAQLLPR